MQLRGDEKILLVPVNGIGDNLMFLPLAYRLKHHSPTIRVDMLSNAANSAARLMRYSPWLDDIVAYSLASNDAPGYAKYFLLEYPRLIARLVSTRYDYVATIVPNVFRRSILRLTRQGKALVNRDRRMNEFEAGHSLLDRFENLERAYRHPPLLEFPNRGQTLARFGLEAGKYVVFNFAAKSPSRAYARGAEVVESIARTVSRPMVVNGWDETIPSGCELVDVRPHTTVEEIATIVGQAAACIAVDSGVLYMATAQDVPAVGLFGQVHSSFRIPPGASDATFIALDAGRPSVAYERRERWSESEVAVSAIDPRDVVACALRILGPA